MTTYTPFTPSQVAVFTFQPVLDGATYNGTVKYNLFGNRPYLLLTDQNGNVVFNQALVGSPIGQNIQSLSWFLGKATATTAAPHGYAVGSVVSLTISGCLPAAYNGIVDAFINGPDTFTWSVPTNPGMTTKQGTVSYDINLAEGYFSDSTLVFREASQQFEVTP